MAACAKYDVVIAGAGPAGLATALYLLRAHPELEGRVAAIEKSHHPRAKVCAGGLIPKTLIALAELGLRVDVPAVEVFGGIARTEAGTIDLGESREPLCTIVRRDEFDAALAHAAREAGLVLIENTRVAEVEHGASGVRIVTSSGALEAQVLVGADGSGSKVRTALFGHAKDNIGRALMVDVAMDPAPTSEFAHRAYRFDFNCVRAGIRGYSWAFPCMIGGRAHLNVGIYDQCPRGSVERGQTKPHLLDELRAAFPEIDLDGARKGTAAFKAFPIRWYDAADRYAAGRVILAGDAAGVDPLMGEGISCAFEHGKLAAKAIADLIGGRGDALAAYGRELHHGMIGCKLRRLAFAARRFYGPRHRLYFRLARMSRWAQELGVEWYNGVNRLDEAPIAAGLARWAAAVLLGKPLR